MRVSWSPERNTLRVQTYCLCNKVRLLFTSYIYYGEMLNKVSLIPVVYSIYNERILQVEKASFVPIVGSTFGGWGDEATKYHKRIASLLAEKRNEQYSDVMNHLRTRLRFCVLRSVREVSAESLVQLHQLHRYHSTWWTIMADRRWTVCCWLMR